MGDGRRVYKSLKTLTYGHPIESRMTQVKGIVNFHGFGLQVMLAVGLPMQLETSSIRVSQYRPTLSKFKIYIYFPGMRVEWAKSRARAERWREEVLLLNEEMRRILQYFHWTANWWLAHQSLRSDVTPEVLHGLNAYAAKQANLLQQLVKSFALLWYPELVKNNMPIEWPSIYIPVMVTSSDAMDQGLSHFVS
jgi:hypothetical protein